MKRKKLNKITFNCFLLFFCSTFVLATPFKSYVCEPKYTTLQINAGGKKSASLSKHITSVSVKAKNAETKITLSGGIQYHLSYNPYVRGWCFRFDSPYIEKEAVIEIQNVNDVNVSLRSKVDGSKDFCSPGNKNFYLMNKDQQTVGVVEVRTTEILPSLKIIPLKKPVGDYLKDISFTQFKRSVDEQKDKHSQILGKFDVNEVTPLSDGKSKTKVWNHQYKIRTLKHNGGGNVSFSQNIINAKHGDKIMNKLSNENNSTLVKMHSSSNYTVTGCPITIASKNKQKNHLKVRDSISRKNASIRNIQK